MIWVCFKLVLKLCLLAIIVLSLSSHIRGFYEGRNKIQDILNRYEPVSALIVDSEIKELKRSSSSRRRMSSRRYAPDIQYNYMVGDQVHIGTRYTGYSYFAYDRQEIQRVVWQNQRGWRVTAYFDPQKPEESVLALPGIQSFSNDKIWRIIFFSLCMVLSWAWLFLSIRSFSRALK